METATQHRFLIRGWILLSITFGVLLLLSWVVVHWDVDRAVAARFYSDAQGWYLKNSQPWKWLYEYGTIPGLILAVAALIAWVTCLVKNRLQHLHRFFLVVVLTAVIGPGLLVNGILKNYWGRPRPRQVQELGGQWEYHHLNQPGTPGRGESFTCGHCTMGFLFLALLAFRRKNGWIAAAGAVAGLGLGGLLGAARVVQGAHFLSDVFWSLGIVLMVVTALYYLVLRVPEDRRRSQKTLTRSNRLLLKGFLTVSVIAALLAFLMHRPFYKEHDIPLSVPPDVHQIVLEANVTIDQLNIQYMETSGPHLEMIARGFGWTEAGHRLHSGLRHEPGRLIVGLTVERHGFFAELTHEASLFLPKAMAHRVEVALQKTGSPPKP